MPLHAETERGVVRPARGLDQTILGVSLRFQPVGEAGDALKMQGIDQQLVASEPVPQSAAEGNLVDRTVHLIERQLIARAVVLMPIDGVDGLMQAAAERDVQLLKTAADGEERFLTLDRGADQRQRQRVAQRVEPVGHQRGFLAVMLRRDVRAAAGEKDRVGGLEKTADVGHAGTDRNEERLAFRDLGDGCRVFATHGVKDISVDERGASRDDDDRTAHAAISPATSLRVRSRARPITSSASSNWACVQISGGAMTIVSNTARMMKPSRKK